MKTAGEVASALFDAQFMKKAQGYSKLFDSWEEITAKNEIAAASAHSRIKDLDRGILLIETDHPGWKQIIQTKQASLLNDFRRRFPEQDISGISLMLGAGKSTTSSGVDEGNLHGVAQNKSLQDEQKREDFSPSSAPGEERNFSNTKGLDTILDEDFKETLKQLGKSISEREHDN
jgi:hypothetical protein